MEVLGLLLSLLNTGTSIFGAAQSAGFQQEGLDLQRQQSGISNLTTLEGLRSNLGQIDVGLQEANFNIGSLTEMLSRFPESASLQRDTYQQQGEGQLRTLQQNLGEQNVAAGIRGVGNGTGPTTASVMGEQARQDVVTFAGSDMALGGAAGLYERGLAELNANLDAQRRTAEGQIGILNTTVDTLERARTNTQTTIDTIGAQIDPATGRFRDPTGNSPGGQAGSFAGGLLRAMFGGLLRPAADFFSPSHYENGQVVRG